MGRKAGTPNKRTQEGIALLEGRFPRWDPLLQMAATAQGMKLQKDGKVVRDNATTPERRDAAAKEVAQYMYPKRKAVEHSGAVATGATSEEAEMLRTRLTNTMRGFIERLEEVKS